MQDIYKIAAQNALLFPSVSGPLMVSQLFELPLTSARGPNLESVAQAVNKDLQAASGETFVPTAKTNPKKAMLEVALAIVKDVIETKVAANLAATTRQDKAVKRAKILDALAAKQDQALTSATVDDLKAQLAALAEE